jgi:SAM-dependent methyltransferase
MTAKLTAAPAERNKQPILDVLQRVLPESGLVLEIASGTGQHIVHFAKALPHLTWQPSDPDPRARQSITAWIAAEALANTREPLALDVRQQPWPASSCDALVCINMVHISPWSATEALFEGAARILPEGGVVYLYGPYRVNGRDTSESNAAFDATLRAQNPEWGVRDLERVLDEASRRGFDFVESVPMPANNLSVVWRRRSGRS